VSFPSSTAFPPGILRSLSLAILLGGVPLLAGLWLGGHGGRAGAVEDTPVIWLGESLACDPAERLCGVGEPGRRIMLRLPHPPRPLQSFILDVSSDLPESTTAVEVQLDMVDMTMAGNRITLQPGPDHWRGEAVLPICTSGRNDWRLQVSVSTPGQRYRADFRTTVDG